MKEQKKIALIGYTFLMLLIGMWKSNAQNFEQTYQNGTYYYTTDVPDSWLTLYLFDDGQYSFDNNPNHQLSFSNVPATAKVFYSQPYEEDEPEDEVFIQSTNGNSNPIPITHVLNNDIDLITSWNLVENAVNYYILRFENNNSETIDGCVAFHYNTGDIKVLPLGILDNYNDWVFNRQIETSELLPYGYTHKITWEFDNMQPGEQRYVYIPTSCTLQEFGNAQTLVLMDKETCFDNMDTHNFDISDYESYVLNSIVSNNPHDPNCILSQPWTLPNDDQPNGRCQLVKYKIYFQNDGEDPAKNVTVRLTTQYPVESIQLIHASDTCYLDPNTDQMFKIFFEEIFLPGTGQSPPPHNFEETVGMFEVHIWYDLSLVVGKCIAADAHIIFDEEAPISVHHEICKSDDYPIDSIHIYNRLCETLTEENTDMLTRRQYFPPIFALYPMSNSLTPTNDFARIFPTVSNGYFALNTDFTNIDGIQVSVFNNQGNHILEQKTNADQTGIIDLSSFQNGFYFVKIFDGIRYETYKIIKI